VIWATSTNAVDPVRAAAQAMLRERAAESPPSGAAPGDRSMRT